MNGFDIQSTAEAFLDQQKELGIFNKNKVRKYDNNLLCTKLKRKQFYIKLIITRVKNLCLSDT